MACHVERWDGTGRPCGRRSKVVVSAASAACMLAARGGVAAAQPPTGQADPMRVPMYNATDGQAAVARAVAREQRVPPSFRVPGGGAVMPFYLRDSWGMDRVCANMLEQIVKASPAMPVTHRAGGHGVSVIFGKCHRRGARAVQPMAANAAYPGVYSAVCEWAALASPDGELHAAAVNVDFGSDDHVDGNLAGWPSVAVTLGRFAGGGLVTGGVEYDICRRPLVFSGEEPHRTGAWEGGPRVCVVLFRSRHDTGPGPRPPRVRRAVRDPVAARPVAPPVALVSPSVGAGPVILTPAPPTRRPISWGELTGVSPEEELALGRDLARRLAGEAPLIALPPPTPPPVRRPPEVGVRLTHLAQTLQERWEDKRAAAPPPPRRPMPERVPVRRFVPPLISRPTAGAAASAPPALVPVVPQPGVFLRQCEKSMAERLRDRDTDTSRHIAAAMVCARAARRRGEDVPFEARYEAGLPPLPEVVCTCTVCMPPLPPATVPAPLKVSVPDVAPRGRWRRVDLRPDPGDAPRQPTIEEAVAAAAAAETRVRPRDAAARRAGAALYRRALGVGGAWQEGEGPERGTDTTHAFGDMVRSMDNDDLHYLANRGAELVRAALRSSLSWNNRSRRVTTDQPMQEFPPPANLEVLAGLVAGNPEVSAKLAEARLWLERPVLRPGGPQVNVPKLHDTCLSPQHFAEVKTVLRKYDGPVVCKLPIRAIPRKGKKTSRAIGDARGTNAVIMDPPYNRLRGIEYVDEILEVGDWVLIGDWMVAFMQLLLGRAWDPYTSPMPGYACDRMFPGLAVAAFVMQQVLNAFLCGEGRASVGYYDDFLIVYSSEAEARAGYERVAARAKLCNVTLSKLEVHRGDQFKFLGVLWNGWRHSRALPESKKDKSVAAMQVLAARAGRTPLEVMSAVGILWHAATVLRAPLLTLGAFRHVLSTVAKHPMRLRLGRGLDTLAKIDIRPALADMAVLLRKNCSFRPSAVRQLPAPRALVLACDAAVEPGMTTCYGSVELPPEGGVLVRHVTPVPPGAQIAFAEALAVHETLADVERLPAGRRHVVIIEDNQVVAAALRNGFSRSPGVARVTRDFLAGLRRLGGRLWLVQVGTERQPGDVVTRPGSERAMLLPGRAVPVEPEWITRAGALGECREIVLV